MNDQKQIPQPNTLIGILGCIGGLFIHLVIGSLYQWGIVSIYFTSYFHHFDSSVTLQQTAITFPLMMFCIGLTMRYGLHLSKVMHPLTVSVLGQVLCATTIFISSYMPNIFLFILFYGIIFGLCAGLNFMVPIYECNKYLIGKKMYVNGLILIGTGAGPVVFGLFSYHFLNPNKIPPIGGYYFGTSELETIAFEVPTLLKFLSLLYLAVGLLGTIMLAPVYIHNKRVERQIRKKQQSQTINQEITTQETHKQHLKTKEDIQLCQTYEQKLKQLNENMTEKQQLSDHQNQSQNDVIKLISKDPTVNSLYLIDKKSKPKNKMINSSLLSTSKVINQPESVYIAFKSKVFWVLILLLFVSSCGSFLLNGNYKTYVKKTIHDDNFLTTIGVIGSFGNGFSRFFWSLYYNKTGFKTAILTILFFQMIVFSTIRFTTSSPREYTFEIFLSNCCIGGYLVTATTATQNIFGQVIGTKIYGFYWCSFALTNFLGYIYVSNLTKLIGFDNVIYICLGMAVIVCPIIVVTKFQGPWGNSTYQMQFFVRRQLSKVEDFATIIQPSIKKVNKQQKLPSIAQIQINETHHQ